VWGGKRSVAIKLKSCISEVIAAPPEAIQGTSGQRAIPTEFERTVSLVPEQQLLVLIFAW
jgi:hypothetical protein